MQELSLPTVSLQGNVYICILLPRAWRYPFCSALPLLWSHFIPSLGSYSFSHLLGICTFSCSASTGLLPSAKKHPFNPVLPLVITLLFLSMDNLLERIVTPLPQLRNWFIWLPDFWCCWSPSHFLGYHFHHLPFHVFALFVSPIGLSKVTNLVKSPPPRKMKHSGHPRLFPPIYLPEPIAKSCDVYPLNICQINPFLFIPMANKPFQAATISSWDVAWSWLLTNNHTPLCGLLYCPEQ